MIRRIVGLVLLAVLCTAGTLRAQYYETGRSPASIRWNQIRTDSLCLIFPTGFERQARRTLYYMDRVRPWVSTGFRYGTMRTPVVFHTQNFRSNGLSMLAPRRIEMIGIPSTDSYAEPWLKQLSVHEYRHNVQYNNINRNTVRVLGWLLGQQASLACTGLLPFWFLEGDAVLCETELSDFGRALQPSFTLYYRAAGDLSQTRNIDKWFCGSYNAYVPSHYHMGYQLVSWAYTRYGENIWDKVADYSSKYPFFLFTNAIALKRFYHTSVGGLFRETFADLHDYWSALPARGDSALPVTVPAGKVHTVYRWPVALDDTTALAIKNDFEESDRLVRFDLRTGAEQTLVHTGSISSRPAVRDGVVYWTEYRQSTLWEQRVNSVPCSYDLRTGRRSVRRRTPAALYITPLPDGRTAHLEYDYDGRYAIVWPGGRCDLPDDLSVHGLAWNETDDRFYFIGLDDEGMWLGAVDRADTAGRGWRRVTPPSLATLSDLRAGGGRLYYGSIASGYDEAYCFDPHTGRQWRLTASTYGAYAPAPLPGGDRVLVAQFTRAGYFPALQPLTDSVPTDFARLPRNVVNPPRRHWPAVGKIDTLRFDETQLHASQREYPARRYRKALNLFNFHSWAPIDYDPWEILSGDDLDFHVGATVVSQNLLSSTFFNFSYGYTSAGSLVRGGLRYYGLAPKFEVEARWGGGRQTVLRTVLNQPAPPRRKPYFDLSARVFLPLLLSSGYHTRYLRPEVQFTHTNALLFDPVRRNYDKGVQMLALSLQYTDNVRMAYREFLPRWGYGLKASWVANPGRSDFSDIWNLFGRVYLPGIVRTHSITLRADWQYTSDGTFGFRQNELFPRGATYDISPIRYTAASFDYQLPLGYPDWGISGLFFLRRVRLNAGYDFARYKSHWLPPGSRTVTTRHDTLWSAGADLILDIVWLRMPDDAVTSLRLSYWKADRRAGFWSVGFDIPL